MNIIKNYKSLTFERKLLYKSIVTATFTFLTSVSKILMGFFIDSIYFVVGGFNLFIVLAKIECVLGIASNKKSFEFRNRLISLFLFLGGLLFDLYMILDYAFDVYHSQHGFITSIVIAGVSFFELGLAIYGFNKAKFTSYFCRNIKIISLIFALNAIISTEFALLSLETYQKTIYYTISGLIVGTITILISIYIYFEPKIGVVNKEINNYILIHPSLNNLIDMSKNDKFYLSKSWTCGSYYYEYEVINNEIRGKIKQEKNVFKRCHWTIKIILIILSEILIFVYGIIRLIFFFRNINIIKRLDKKMGKNGFKKIEN